MGLMKARKTRFNGQSSVVSHHVGRRGVARRETLLSVHHSDAIKPDSDSDPGANSK
jgi:hypothetical protein